MEESSPAPAEPSSRITRLLDALDRLLFRDPDLRATARGWQVRRPRRFRRVYRDPRWDLVSPCGACAGTGAAGAHDCPDCDGSGRVIARPDERAVRP
jgi:hypothetical protein